MYSILLLFITIIGPCFLRRRLQIDVSGDGPRSGTRARQGVAAVCVRVCVYVSVRMRTPQPRAGPPPLLLPDSLSITMYVFNLKPPASNQTPPPHTHTHVFGPSAKGNTFHSKLNSDQRHFNILN